MKFSKFQISTDTFTVKHVNRGLKHAIYDFFRIQRKWIGLVLEIEMDKANRSSTQKEPLENSRAHTHRGRLARPTANETTAWPGTKEPYAQAHAQR